VDPKAAAAVSHDSNSWGPTVYCPKHGLRNNTMCVPCFHERAYHQAGFERELKRSFWHGFFSVFGLRRDART
jgi:hypothetical protein